MIRVIINKYAVSQFLVDRLIEVKYNGSFSIGTFIWCPRSFNRGDRLKEVRFIGNIRGKIWDLNKCLLNRGCLLNNKKKNK